MRANVVFQPERGQKTARGDVVMYSTIVNMPADTSHAADELRSVSFAATDDVVTTFEPLSSDSNVPQRSRWKVKRISGAAP